MCSRTALFRTDKDFAMEPPPDVVVGELTELLSYLPRQVAMKPELAT